MALSEQQRAFTRMVVELLTFALSQPGIEITLGEAYRTPEQAALNVKEGKSQTDHSYHCNRLAIDLFLWKNDELTWKIEDYIFLGAYWESLGGVWGGRWEKLRDAVHFQYGEHRLGAPSPGKVA